MAGCGGLGGGRGEFRWAGCNWGGRQVGVKLGVSTVGRVALISNEAAYMAEIIRGGFLAIPPGQADAAKALGLNRWQTLIKIQLPQAIRIDTRTGRPSDRLIAKLTASVTTTTAMMTLSSIGPEAAIAMKVMEAPSKATASSSICLAENAMPTPKRRSGSHSVRIAVPSKIAITMASR